jgi:hypothetical protein
VAEAMGDGMIGPDMIFSPLTSDLLASQIK